MKSMKYIDHGIERSVPVELIEESHKKCMQLGLSHDAAVFDIPDVQQYEGTLPYTFCKREAIFADITAIMNESVAKYGGVIFYAKQNGFIYAESGDPILMHKFREKNLAVGGYLKEEYLGTTAASFVMPGMERYLIGDDHYFDILKNYTTYCAQYTSYVSNYYIFVVMPNSQLTDFFLTHMKLFNIAKIKAIFQYKQEIELRLKDNLLSRQYKQQAVLYIDKYGVVINGNQQFLNWFDFELINVIDNDFVSVLPELETIRNDILSTKAFRKDDFVFLSAPPNMRTMSIEVSPIFERNRLLGILLIISNDALMKNTPKNVRPKYNFNDVIGSSKIMRNVKHNAINAAQSDSSIVLVGESGTGKEYFAQAIHNESKRKEEPFVSINCSSMPKELISSELFGYIDGAFTGGRKGGAMGKFEYANKGTIFLDEIGDMPMDVQSVLLRVLEERTIYRLGSNTPLPINVRVICATNKNLKELVQNGKFRLDLYYRINVINIMLPPLRNRKADLNELIVYHLDIFNKQTGKNIKGLTNAAIKQLLEYNWPGNLRELRNMVEYGVNNATEFIDKCHLPNDILDNNASLSGAVMDMSDYCAERDELIQVIVKYKGNKTMIAKALGIARGTLYRKLEEYRLDTKMYAKYRAS